MPATADRGIGWDETGDGIDATIEGQEATREGAETRGGRAFSRGRKKAQELGQPIELQILVGLTLIIWESRRLSGSLALYSMDEL